MGKSNGYGCGYGYENFGYCYYCYCFHCCRPMFWLWQVLQGIMHQCAVRFSSAFYFVIVMIRNKTKYIRSDKMEIHLHIYINPLPLHPLHIIFLFPSNCIYQHIVMNEWNNESINSAFYQCFTLMVVTHFVIWKHMHFPKENVFLF